MSNLRITEEDFWKAAKKTRLGARALEAVYDVLVLGKDRKIVTERLGVSGARLNHMIVRIKNAYLDQREAPREWEVITVAFPKILAHSVKKLSKRLVEWHAKGKDINQTISIKKPTCTLTLETHHGVPSEREKS